MDTDLDIPTIRSVQSCVAGASSLSDSSMTWSPLSTTTNRVPFRSRSLTESALWETFCRSSTDRLTRTRGCDRWVFPLPIVTSVLCAFRARATRFVAYAPAVFGQCIWPVDGVVHRARNVLLPG